MRADSCSMVDDVLGCGLGWALGVRLSHISSREVSIVVLYYLAARIISWLWCSHNLFHLLLSIIMVNHQDQRRHLDLLFLIDSIVSLVFGAAALLLPHGLLQKVGGGKS